MLLTTGEEIIIDCAPVQKGIVSWIHGIASVDTMREMKFGDTLAYGNFETTNNALRVKNKPGIAINAVLENGLHSTTITG